MPAFHGLAVDYDGTLTLGSERPRSDVLDAVARARTEGLYVVLVTGRIMSELEHEFPDVRAHFDAIVSENGGVLDHGARHQLLARPVPPALTESLREDGVELRTGEVLLALSGADVGQVAKAIRRLELDCQLLRNRGELMVLPAGVTKAAGAASALDVFGISMHDVIAVGDAENDAAMLVGAELGVAVANAIEPLKAVADRVLVRADGEGIVELLTDPVVRGEVPFTSQRRRFVLGVAGDGQLVTIPAARCNVLVAGPSHSGKSYIGGLIAERAAEAGYRFLLVDHEGDHIGLARLPHVVALGGDRRLPDPTQISTLLRSMSVVADLSLLTVREQEPYVRALCRAVSAERRAHGVPEWLLVDEAQRVGSLLQPIAASCRRGVVLISWHEDQLPASLLATVDVRLEVGPGHGEATVHQRDTAAVTPIRVAARATGHVRHRRKYSSGDLPHRLRFLFRTRDGEVEAVAANLRSFTSIIEVVSDAALHDHLLAGDCSRWVRDVLSDEVLARELADVEHAYARSLETEVARAAIVDAITDRYAW